MIKRTLYLVIILICNNIIAQDFAVTLSKNKIGKNYGIYATNNSNETQLVTLFVETKNYKPHPSEVKKTVTPKDSVLMIRLRPVPGKKSSFSLKYVYEAKPSQAEQKVKETALKKLTFIEGDDINKGIVVFDKDDCSRCDRTTSYLLDNKIPFKRIQIPTAEQRKSGKVPAHLKNNLELLWKIMGPVGRFTTPVIVVDGVVSHSHEDLIKFLVKLK